MSLLYAKARAYVEYVSAMSSFGMHSLPTIDPYAFLDGGWDGRVMAGAASRAQGLYPGMQTPPGTNTNRFPGGDSIVIKNLARRTSAPNLSAVKKGRSGQTAPRRTKKKTKR